MDSNNIRAALYTRVSTEEQANVGFSLDAQMKKLEFFCKSQGWTIAEKYREEGHSGRNINRPEYKRMMSEIDSWDVLLVLKMDRIHRSSENFTRMMKDLKKSGKDFCSMMEQFDTTTANGRFVMDLIQRIAQLESEQIGERVKYGMKQKAKTGDGLMGFGQPYGYDYVNGELRVNENETTVVSSIYDMYNNGMSMQKIADSLNSDNIPAKKGGLWKRQSVCNILHNPLYAGYIQWDGMLRKGVHKAIIDIESYTKINGQLITDV